MTTGKKSIADKLRERGFPQIPEDQYQENISHFVSTVCSCEDETMITDLKSKTVEEIITLLRQHALPDPHDEREVLHAPLLAEAASRLEEAQQKIISHQAKSRRIGKWMSAALDDQTVCEEMKVDINFFMLDDFAALVAHDAELTAKAKAEALG